MCSDIRLGELDETLWMDDAMCAMERGGERGIEDGEVKSG